MDLQSKNTIRLHGRFREKGMKTNGVFVCRQTVSSIVRPSGSRKTLS